MKIWITTDTHLGHANLIKYCARPENFDALIIKKHWQTIEKGDVLIHLGDVAIGQEALRHKEFLAAMPSLRNWLVKGNHDSKSDKWYLEQGWDFVSDQIRMTKFGLTIALTHAPIMDDGYDLNIHGHFHNSDHRDAVCKNTKQVLIMLEHTYAPQSLESIVKQFRNKGVPAGSTQEEDRCTCEDMDDGVHACETCECCKAKEE